MARAKSFRQMIIKVQSSAEVKREAKRARYLEETEPIVEGLANEIFLALTNNHAMKDLEEATIRAARKSGVASNYPYSLFVGVNSPTNLDKLDKYIGMARDGRILELLNERLARLVESKKRYIGVKFAVLEVDYKTRQVTPTDQLIYEITLTVAW